MCTFTFLHVRDARPMGQVTGVLHASNKGTDMNQRMRSSTATLVAPEHTVPPVLHGADPLRGHPVTWHFTPMSSPEIDGPACLVERVDGTMSNPDVWMQARKETVVLAMSDVVNLIRTVHARIGNAA